MKGKSQIFFKHDCRLYIVVNQEMYNFRPFLFYEKKREVKDFLMDAALFSLLDWQARAKVLTEWHSRSRMYIAKCLPRPKTGPFSFFAKVSGSYIGQGHLLKWFIVSDLWSYHCFKMFYASNWFAHDLANRIWSKESEKDQVISW